jgi:hypothetical protein
VDATRRGVCLGGIVASTVGAAGTVSTCEPAQAATLELADVTPTIVPPAPLTEMEKALINVFEASTRSVVNVFDLSLQGRNVQAQVVWLGPISPPFPVAFVFSNNTALSQDFTLQSLSCSVQL